jgi:glutaminase
LNSALAPGNRRRLCSIVGSEPSGDTFASLARLETHGPLPSNPLVNSGAIALCGQLPGSVQQRVAWLSRWAERLYGAPAAIDEKVCASERATGARNRAIAYYLQASRVLSGLILRELSRQLGWHFALASEPWEQGALPLPGADS